MFKKRSASIGIILIVLAVAGVGIVTIATVGNSGSKEWRDVRGKIMPQFLQIEAKDHITNVLWKPFSSQVAIGYVVDAGSKYEYIDTHMMEKWGVTQAMIEEQAMRNLDARSRNINVEVAESSEDDPNAKYVIVELDDGYSAARLLSAGVRKAIARELGDEYIAAIPTRDFLIFWHKEFPLFAAFSKQVETEYTEETEYPLTPAPFFVSKSGIEEMVRNEEYRY